MDLSLKEHNTSGLIDDVKFDGLMLLVRGSHLSLEILGRLRSLDGIKFSQVWWPLNERFSRAVLCMIACWVASDIRLLFGSNCSLSPAESSLKMAKGYFMKKWFCVYVFFYNHSVTRWKLLPQENSSLSSAHNLDRSLLENLYLMAECFGRDFWLMTIGLSFVLSPGNLQHLL